MPELEDKYPRHKSDEKLSRDKSEMLPMLNLSKSEISDDGDDNVIFESPIR